MHFVPYPNLPKNERVRKSAYIDLSRIKISPAAALSFAPHANRLRLVGIAGRPVYVLHVVDAPVIAVAADTGTQLAALSAFEAQSIAMAFQGSYAPTTAWRASYDQWTVAQEFDAFRPFYRVAFNDREGTMLYVSARSGEVLQRTEASERFWNWCGANIHWIYFSALRAHWTAWDRVVWWLSLTGLLTTLAGVSLGWVRFAAVRRFRRRKLTSFGGWLAWHHRIGLFAGPFVLIWIFSGWLSMDHGRIFSIGAPTAEQVSRLQGMSLQSIAEAVPVSAIQAAGPASEILISAVAGHAFLAARGGEGQARISWLDGPSSAPTSTIPGSLLMQGIRQTWPNEPVTDQGTVSVNNLYSLAEGMPAGSRAFRIEGSKHVDVYVDSVSGRIVTVMDSSRRAYAWAYYGLHTFKFPGLVARPMLRQAAILFLLAVGFVFSVTGIFVAVSRLRATRAAQ